MALVDHPVGTGVIAPLRRKLGCYLALSAAEAAFLEELHEPARRHVHRKEVMMEGATLNI